VLAATAVVVACSGMQALPDEADNNTFPAPDPDSSALTITDTCLSGARLLLAFRLNGKTLYTSLARTETRHALSVYTITVPCYDITSG